MHVLTNSKNCLMLMIIAMMLVITGCSSGNSDSAEGGVLANPGNPTTASYQLVWSDEFDGDTLDSTKWDVQLGDGSSEGNPGWGNAELQYYTADNITQVDGNLVITARKGDSPDPNFDYTSARIRTQNKLDFTYGRVEASIKVPQGVGLWAAFWMLGSDPSPYGVWAGKGEIDIMESFGQNTSFSQAALHYGMQFPLNQTVFKQPENAIDPTDGFHQYAVEWDLENIRWYIDGEHFFTVRAATYWNYYYKNNVEGFVEGSAAAPFNSNQHILLNMAVGGNPSLAPTMDTVFPAEMLVEYVKVYECPIDPQNTGLGCAGSIDKVNPFIIADVPPADVSISSYDLYLNGAGTLFANTEGERSFDIAVFDNNGALILSEVAATDGGTVIDVVSIGGGNFSLVDAAGGTFSLIGMGNANDPGIYGGEIKFDIQVISGDETDPEGLLQVRFDSGFPNVGFVELPISSLPQDQWTSVSVKISDMIMGGQGAFGGGPADVGALESLLTLEPTSSIHMQVNNIRLVCGHPVTCGIDSVATTPLTLFDDAVDSAWGRGIEAFDTVAETYSDGATTNHITWELFETGEEGHDTVIETTFDNSGASGVTYIGGPQGGSVNLSSYSEGELVFDIRVLSNPNNLPMIYKVDGVNGGGTGEQSLGVLPLNEWQTFNIPVENLQTAGLDLNAVSAFVLLPTFAGQDIVFQWDNIRFEATTSGAAAAVEFPVDFETVGAFYNFINFEGGVSAVVANPDMSGNPSATVAQMRKLAADSGLTFGGSVLTLDNPIDFTASEMISMKVWSARSVRVNFKLEGLDNVEIEQSTSGTGWEVLNFDFTGQTTADVTGVSFIFDNGVLGDWDNNPDDWTFYYDDIEVAGSGSPAPLTGVLLDSAISGVTFTTATQLGVTNAQGEFLYMPGEMITFSIGGILLGTVAGGDIITPVELTASVDPTSDAAVNLLVFLQSIDSDRNHANGISISPALIALAAGVTVDFTSATFDSEITALVSQLTEGANPVVSDSDALNNFYLTYVEIGGTDGVNFLFPGRDPVPAVAEPIFFSADFESADPVAATIGDGWTTFVNVFGSPSGDYGYGTFASPNATGAISGIGSGEEGPAQGSQYLNLFSDYNNADHATSALIQVLTFQERVLAASDSGTYTLSFDAKAPVTGGIAAPSTASAFIKTLDPNAGFVTTSEVTVDLSSIGNTDWTTYSIQLPVNASTLSGQLLQFGFTNTATDYNDSGILFDNINFATQTGSGNFVDVTVTVDMSGVSLAGGDTVYVSGSWDDFCAGCNPLTNNGDGTWSTTLSLNAGTYDYKFQLNQFASQETVPAEPACGVTTGDFTNRQLTVAASAVTTGLTPYNGCVGDTGGSGGTASGEFTDFEGAAESYVFRLDPVNGLPGFAGGEGYVVANPDTTGNGALNPSATVGQMSKYAGEVYGGTTFELASAITVAAGDTFSMKVWSPRPVMVLFKLEGGAVGEINMAHGGSGWEEMSFAGFTEGGGFTPGNVDAITLIFDLGTAGDAGNTPADWTFYFDDIERVAAGSGGGTGEQLAINGDFELGNLSGWTEAIGGGTGASITADNTQDSGSNWTAHVVAGAGNNPAISQANLAMGTVNPGDTIDISFDMCGSLEGISGQVRPALLSEFGINAGADRQDLDVFNELPSVWTRYNYTATAGANVDGGVSLQLDVICGSVEGCSGDVYFDNVSVTIGGGTAPGSASGFSCVAGGGTGGGTASGEFTDFEGAAESHVFRLDTNTGLPGFGGGEGSVAANPDTSGNGALNPSAAVGQMIKYAGEVYGGTTFELASAVTVAAGDTFSMKVWSPRPVMVLFKLEGGAVGEINMAHGGSGWEEMTFAGFTEGGGFTPGNVDAVTLIFDLGTNGAAATDPANWTFYFDDITYVAAGGGGTGGSTTVAPIDFEGAAETYVFRLDPNTGLPGFAGGEGYVVANPDTSGNDAFNPSATVGQMLKYAGEVYGGTTLETGGVIAVAAGDTFSMKVWSLRPVMVLFKLEGGAVGEINMAHGGTGWEEMTFAGFTEGGGFTPGNVDAITLIFDLGSNGAAATDPANWTFYFDDITYVTAGGGTGGGGGGAPAGELASNGGFETGDFSDWAQYPSAGTTQTIVTDNPSEGNFAANVNIPAGAGGVNNVLKLERLLDGTGQLSAGQVVNISFDYRGSAADGGVLFVENFCETADPLCGQDLTQLTPAASWANYSATFTLGANVTSYSLQLAAVCGAAATCTTDYYFDNFSITVSDP